MPLCPDPTFLLPDRNYKVVANAAARPVGAALITGMTIFQVDVSSELLWDGAGWIMMAEPAQTWVPTWASGVTLGNGVWSAATYHRNDGWVDFGGVFTLGTTSAVTGPPTFNLPVSALAIEKGNVSAELGDGGAAFYEALGTAGGVTQTQIRYLAASGLPIVYAPISSTAPFTWAATDTIKVAGRYRMATRSS